jgi:hypothetical protein
LVGWIYVESQLLFYHVGLNYGIRREAFNAKYDREEECVGAGMQASHVALVLFKIATVVDTSKTHISPVTESVNAPPQHPNK